MSITNTSQGQDGAVIDVDVSDAEFRQIVKNAFVDSEKYWNDEKGANLKGAREKIRKAWAGKYYEDIDMYEHEVPYVDNRLFVDIETTASIVNSRTPQPEVMAGNETQTSMSLAKDVQKGVFRVAEKMKIKTKFRIATRVLLTSRFALLKFYWNANKGKNGDVDCEVVKLDDVIIDHRAVLGANPLFIAVKYRHTIEELINKFPEKKAEIFKHFDIVKGWKSQLTRIVSHWEVHFTRFTDDGQQEEWIADMINFDLILNKMTTPNWLDEKKKGTKRNFFDQPMKPFIPFNLFNFGEHWIDETSAAEQALPQQEILNKRGKQITENADQANGGRIFNTDMIKKKDIAKLTGAPDEMVGVAGDVRQAATRLTSPQLADYVVQQQQDARMAVDNIFGTNNVTRGETSGNKTLGQDTMQLQQNITRLDEVVRSVDEAADAAYRWIVQLMKVYYTEEHHMAVSGENGEYDYVVLKSDDIEDGLDITVRSGSTMPPNKAQQRSDVVALANSGLVDPYTLYDQLGFDNPQQMVERLIDWKLDPMKFAKQVKDDEFNREAFMDIQMIKRGKEVEARSKPGVEYLRHRNEYMLTGEFQDLDAKIRKAYVKNLEKNTENAKRILGLMSQVLPSKEDMFLSGQQAASQATLGQQVAAGQGQVQQPGNQTSPEQAQQIAAPSPFAQ